MGISLPHVVVLAEMDIVALQMRLGMDPNEGVVRKAQELQRLCNVHFNSASFGVNDICKSVLCFELACTALHVPFNRNRAARIAGLLEKTYSRSLNLMQNALDLRPKLDVRELAIKFGCVRLVSIVNRSLAIYKERFVTSLPAARRKSADFSRPIFIAVAFYLCARKYKLKVDKSKILQACSSSESEFNNIVSSMTTLCGDTFATTQNKVPTAILNSSRKRKLNNTGANLEKSEDTDSTVTSSKKVPRMQSAELRL